MTRPAFLISISTLCCIITIITIASGGAAPSMAFTASSYGSMKQRTKVTAVQQRANNSPQEPNIEDLPQRRPLRCTTPLIPSYISTTAMAVLTILLSLPLQPSYAGLLEEYGAGLTVNSPITKSETVVTTTPASTNGGGAVQIDPTLRGSYYYPTAKKRYLPRILKASDALNTLPNELSVAAKSISTTSQEEYNWDHVLELVAMVDDAVLPLQLYQSSLNGQGLSLSNEYAVRMKDAALRYERSAKQLTTLFQIGKKNTNPTKTLVTNLSTQETKIQSILVDLTEAMNEYRKQGRLTDADNMSIPSATPEEMRRMAMRSKPSTSSSTSTTTTVVP